MTSPFRLGFPRFSPAKHAYNQQDEAQFRLTVEQLLRALTSATNDTNNLAYTIAGTLSFVPDNTYDVGTPIGPFRPRSVYAGTHFEGPRGVFTTRVTSPLLGTTTDVDTVLDRNGVPQLTLSSLLATFAGAGTFNGVVLPGTANTHDIGSTTATWRNAYFQGTGYFGGLASLQASDPLAGAVTPITLRDYGRNVFEYRTDSALEYDGPGTHFVRRSSTGGAALINWLVGELTFSGGYESASTTLVNAIIYGQARETFTTYGTHGATDLVFGTKASGTTTANAQAKARLLAEGHWVPQTDNLYDLGADTTTGGTLRRWRSLRLGTDLRIDAGTGAGGIVHQYLRSTGESLRWGVGLIGLDSGSNAGSNYALWRYSDAGALLGNWLTVTRSTGAWTVTGDGTVTGDLTVTSDNLNVRGLTYTWPSSQAANRVLRNTGPGTLAWSQVDLSTDVTGALAGGTVPASRVTTGTFGAGDYVFPGQLTLTGHLLNASDNTYDIGASGANRFRSLYLGTSVVTPLVTNAGTLALSATGNNIITGTVDGVDALRLEHNANATSTEYSLWNPNGPVTGGLPTTMSSVFFRDAAGGRFNQFVDVVRASATAANAPTYRFIRGEGTASSPTQVMSGTRTLYISAQPIAAGSAIIEHARVTVTARENVGSSTRGAVMAFEMGQVGGSSVVTMVQVQGGGTNVAEIVSGQNTLRVVPGSTAFVVRDSGDTFDAAVFNAAGTSLTLAGTVATAAPTGGSGAWKLGVANAVSPTAPDRTLTVEVGGTTYYIHAKLTND